MIFSNFPNPKNLFKKYRNLGILFSSYLKMKIKDR